MFYVINTNNRWIAPQIEYNSVDWASLDSIIEALESRLNEWYIRPAEILRDHSESTHLAFPVMALNCMLLETLSQFAKGSGPAKFKEFVREQIPEFAEDMPEEIEHKDPQRPAGVTLKTYADALYHGFRCGILHETHVAAYGMVRSDFGLVAQVAEGFTTYPSGADCPTVMIDPWKLLLKVKAIVALYIARLKNRDPANNDLRTRFKTKFSESFGVDITGAI